MVISNPARIRIDNDRLVIIQDIEVALPVEDIAVLLLESPQVSLSSAALARLAENGVAVVVCGPNHLPVLIGFPCAAHSRLAGVHRLQLQTSVPFRKRCWQRIVQAKIANQAECLRQAGLDGADAIDGMSAKVRSGDPDNIESVAAREYFKKLFGPDFDRRINNGINSALNYGYAVIRAAVARSLVAFGFLLTQGIHHSSELNAFNLADDFLEPFRPIVDLCVATRDSFQELRDDKCETQDDSTSKLEKHHRQELASLLAVEVGIENERHSLLRASELVASSFGSAIRSKDPKMLKVPRLIGLREHGYE